MAPPEPPEASRGRSKRKALSAPYGGTYPIGGGETVEKACHCEEAQRADVAIRS